MTKIIELAGEPLAIPSKMKLLKKSKVILTKLLLSGYVKFNIWKEEEFNVIEQLAEVISDLNGTLIRYSMYSSDVIYYENGKLCFETPNMPFEGEYVLFL